MSGPARTSGPLRVGGIDVQQNRRCPYVVLEASSPRSKKTPRCVATGWLANDSERVLREELTAMLAEQGVAAVGIDAPRQLLPSPRWWKVAKGAWTRSPKPLVGRHCEVVIASSRLANPQWTPLAGDVPGWMTLGFALFQAASELLGDRVYEVFPSAAYRQLAGSIDLRLELLCGDFSPGPKDLLDAGMAALTTLEHELGRGTAVGGGDGLGTIILPRPDVPVAEALLDWPDED